MNITERLSLLLGHLTMLFLLFHSVVYATERVLYLDSAYYLFELIQTNSVFFSGRPTSWLFLLMPLASIQWDFPLDQVIVLYSLSFPFVFYFVFILVSHLFRSPYWGVVIALSLILTTKLTAYYCVSEIIQAQVFSIAFTAALFYSAGLKRSAKGLVSVVLFALLALWSHPAAFFMLSSGGMLFLVSTKGKDRIKLVILSLGAICVFYLTKVIGSVQDGESVFFARIWETSNYHDFLSSPAILYMAPSGDHGLQYVSVYAIFTLVLLTSALQKRWLPVLVSTFFVLAYILVNTAIYSEGDSAQILEKSLLPVITLILLPLPVLLENMSSSRTIVYGVVILGLVALGVNRIGKNGREAQKRMEWIEAALSKIKSQGSNKGFALRDSEIKDYGPDWAVPFESLLYSSAYSTNSATIVVREALIESNQSVFIGPEFYGAIRLSSLNSSYFDLKEEPYKVFTP